MVAIYAFRYTKAQLDRAPEDERTFLLMLCHLLNDCAYLQKVTLVALNTRDNPEPVGQTSLMLSLTMLRLLAGRVREGYSLIQWQWSPLAKRYPEIGKGHETVKALRRYFDKKNNAVHRIRNDAGFHESPEHVIKAYNDYPEDAPLVDFLGNAQGNSVYVAADLIRARAMQHITGQPDFMTFVRTVPPEIISVSAMFADFANDFIPAFWERYMPELRPERPEDITIEVPARPLGEATLPFFSEDP